MAAAPRAELAAEDVLIERPDLGPGCSTLIAKGDHIPPAVRAAAPTAAAGAAQAQAVIAMWPFPRRLQRRQQMSLEELLAESGTPTWAGVQVGADQAMRLSAV
jgi:hypothetical protein